MLYILKNDQLSVTISSRGAETVSIKCAGDCEYIWQGDEKYWTGQSPLLFPICGRLFGGKYTYLGKEYSMIHHGFARRSEFEAVSVSDTCAVLRLRANEETFAEYPFDFEFTVTYTLNGARLDCKHEIKNTGKDILPAVFGAHPGFNVPLCGESDFSDWYLEFGEECSPDELVFSETCFNTGYKKALPLVNGKILPLRHSLFDIDGVFMSRMASSVTLKSDKCDRYVRLEYADMPYLGIWHAPRSDAPYVCIEPWCGLPAFDGKVDDMATKNDMFRIPAGSSKTVGYSMIFG